MSLDNHHAHLLIGSWDKEALLRELLSELGLPLENNPDLFVHEGDLGIDEARYITQRVATRPVLSKRVLILDVRSITLQAQNALLKTLEDPGEGNIFFLVAPHEDILLPTLRSRMRISKRDGEDESLNPKKFLNLEPKKRLEFAKKFKDEERPLGPFLDAVLIYMKNEGAPTETLEKIFTLRRYADDTSSDSRLILEHLSLVI